MGERYPAPFHAAGVHDRAAVGGRTTRDPQQPRSPHARAHVQAPVPVVARIEWEHDGEEHVETVALGWTDRRVYVRLPDSRWRFTSIWLRVEDVRRR